MHLYYHHQHKMILEEAVSHRKVELVELQVEKTPIL